MDYQINFKSYDPVANETKVSIVQRYPYRSMEESLVGDRTHDNETNVVEDVLNVIRTELDPSGAIIKLEKELEESTKTVQLNHKTVEDAQLALFANAEEIDNIQNKIDQILKHIGLVLKEDDETDDSDTHVDSDPHIESEARSERKTKKTAKTDTDSDKNIEQEDPKVAEIDNENKGEEQNESKPDGKENSRKNSGGSDHE